MKSNFVFSFEETSKNFCIVPHVSCVLTVVKLIIQLKRFNFSNGATYKNSFPVVCSPYLNVPVCVDNEVTCIRNFALISGICHSGKLDSGHYTAFVRDSVCGVWLHFNDRAVKEITLESLHGSQPYVLFYKAC